MLALEADILMSRDIRAIMHTAQRGRRAQSKHFTCEHRPFTRLLETQKQGKDKRKAPRKARYHRTEARRHL